MKELFEMRSRGHGHPDMVPHMQQLADLASLCKHITEFGVRSGQSTVALAYGLTKKGGGKLVSYDINKCDRPFGDSVVDWQFIQADTTKIQSIERTDLLFIDTLHTKEQVEQELRFADNVNMFLVFHDVREWGWNGEGGQKGINYAIFEFLITHPEWRVLEMHESQWGLLVLTRNL